MSGYTNGGSGAATSITIGTTTITGGADTQVLFNDGGFVGSDAGFTYNKTTDSLTLLGGISLGGDSSLTGQWLANVATAGDGARWATSSDTTPTTLTTWDARHHVVAAAGTGNTAGGVGFGYNQTSNIAYEYSITPGTAWRQKNAYANTFSFLPQVGSNTISIGANSNNIDVNVGGTTIFAITTGANGMLFRDEIEASTAGVGAPNVLTASESGKFLTNEGATAEAYNTLPTASMGYVFTFYCQDTDGIRVTASAGDTIRLGASVSAAAGFVRSVVAGSAIRLTAINATEWVATTVVGTWTVDA